MINKPCEDIYTIKMIFSGEQIGWKRVITEADIGRMIRAWFGLSDKH